MRECARLDSILDPQSNSFTLARLVAASAVIVSHGFEIAVGREAPQPLSGLSPFNLGQHAVNVFFVLSGLTLAQSLATKPDLGRFLVARLLRIVPGLLAYGLVLCFFAGPLLSSRPLGLYFSSAETYLYSLDVMFRYADAAPPPGLFNEVPVAGVVNEPLWTIRYEIIAYIGLGMLAAFGFFPNPVGVAFASLGVIAAFATTEAIPAIVDEAPFVGSLTRFGLCFMTGVAAYSVRHRIVLSHVLLLAGAGAIWVLNDTSLARGASILFVAYMVFVLASWRWGVVGDWTRKHDISYGTYLYGWPIQQTLMVLSPGMSAISNIAMGLVIAPIAGLISWMLVERPALAIKSQRRSPTVLAGEGSHRSGA